MFLVSVTADPHRIEDLDAAIAELTAIKNRTANIEAVERSIDKEQVGVADAASSPTPSASDAERALDDLWPRINVNLRKLMKAAAAFDQPYDTRLLADALGWTVPATRASRGTLGRSMNAVYSNVPAAPRFFEKHEEPGGKRLASIHPAYRDGIAAQDLLAPYASGTVPTE